MELASWGRHPYPVFRLNPRRILQRSWHLTAAKLLSPFIFRSRQRRPQGRSILQRVEGRRITALWYGLEDGYVRIELDDGSVLLVAASLEGCHVMVDSGPRARNTDVPGRGPKRMTIQLPTGTAPWVPTENNLTEAPL